MGDGRSISRHVASLNILVHDRVDLCYLSDHFETSCTKGLVLK